MSEDAHRYGTSFSNQRIENWWSHMRKGFTNWLIEFFTDLVNENIFVPENQTHLECSWLVFSSLLQTELDEFSCYWNSHYILQSRHDSVAGIPDVMSIKNMTLLTQKLKTYCGSEMLWLKENLKLIDAMLN